MNNPLAPIWTTSPGRWDFPMAAHLLRRAGFGGTLAEIRDLLAMGPEKAVASIVNFANRPNPGIEELAFGDLTHPPQEASLRLPRAGARVISFCDKTSAAETLNLPPWL